jgi:hypothetical protein
MHSYKLTHNDMPNSKVFRVLISESQGFYVDTEAASADEAMEKVRSRLEAGTVTPIEDNSSYEGYKVEDAIKIKREDAHLE